MNLFWLDLDPKVNAQYHCDKHVVKMILEATQLLCTAHHTQGRLLGYNVDKDALYNATHENHPCAEYTRSSRRAYFYVLDYARYLSEEYQWRYGNFHKCDNLLDGILDTPPVGLSDQYLMNRPQCMPEVYKSANVVTSYRKYYKHDKKSILKWSRRPVPEFMYDEAI